MSKPTRREFAALAATLPLALSVDGQQKKAGPAATPPLAEALAGIVRAEAGAHLSAEELATVREDFAEGVEGIERLRAFPLVNADEPDFTFTVRARR